MSIKSIFASIHKIDAEPELKFTAALLADAVELARSGDCDAYFWLEQCSLQWLWMVTPAGDDCERIQEALLATIPEPDCPASATGSSVQAWAAHEAVTSGAFEESRWGTEVAEFVQTVMTEVLEAMHAD